MADENTAPPQSGDTLTPPQEAAAGSATVSADAAAPAPPAPANVKEDKKPNASRTPAPASNTGSNNAPGMHVKWHADALADGHVYHGLIRNISAGGTDIYFDLNLQKVKSFKLRIHVPLASKTSPPHVIEVSGKVVFTSYDSTESMFHTNINFLAFKNEADRKYLQTRITAFNKTK